MHPRGCYCDDCNPGTRAKPTRVYTTKRWRKHLQNQRYWQKRKLRDAGY